MRSIRRSACFISPKGLIVFMLSELAHAPMTQHAGMKEILIDGRQLVLEHDVEVLEHLGIALHDRLRFLHFC
jgi:hypothetical protein